MNGTEGNLQKETVGHRFVSEIGNLRVIAC